MASFYLIIIFLLSISSVSALAGSSVQIEIDLIARKLELKDEGELIKSYPIGVAKSKEFITPPGSYKIEVKDRDPGWINPFNPKIKIPPGKNNPLGTRWIGFHGKEGGEYGIHGTNKPDSIGKNVSHGCIRMLIPDIEDLFERVEIGTQIFVYYEPFEIIEKEKDLILKIKEDPYKLFPLTVDNLEKQIIKKYPKAIINKNAIELILKEKNLPNLTRLVGYLESTETNTEEKKEQFPKPKTKPIYEDELEYEYFDQENN